MPLGSVTVASSRPAPTLHGTPYVRLELCRRIGDTRSHRTLTDFATMFAVSGTAMVENGVTVQAQLELSPLIAPPTDPEATVTTTPAAPPTNPRATVSLFKKMTNTADLVKQFPSVTCHDVCVEVRNIQQRLWAPPHGTKVGRWSDLAHERLLERLRRMHKAATEQLAICEQPTKKAKVSSGDAITANAQNVNSQCAKDNTSDSSNSSSTTTSSSTTSSSSTSSSSTSSSTSDDEEGEPEKDDQQNGEAENGDQGVSSNSSNGNAKDTQEEEGKEEIHEAGNCEKHNTCARCDELQGQCWALEEEIEKLKGQVVHFTALQTEYDKGMAEKDNLWDEVVMLRRKVETLRNAQRV